ncbi:alpha/beta fold hydrolase [Metabacillus sp. RGM 3146]|uniref:alpha/beta fold hydrolase n=1 Tax=Metabacillus sp. RGM 3146 TaxID=3401092 RepID=UPI003B9BA58D
MLKRKASIIKYPSSISELLSLTVGGITQWIYVRGEDRHNPILLILHGGPGTGQIGYARRWQKELEKHFVVVNWDQRGTGLSFSRKLSSDSMTISQFVNDTISVTDYLCSVFQKDKIYLAGHSWGSIPGILAAQKAPERYFRYFGISQLIDYTVNDLLSYKKLLEKAKEGKNKKAVKALENIGPPTWKNQHDEHVYQKFLQELGGGVSHDGKLIGSFLKQMIIGGEYTFSDMVNYLKGQHFSRAATKEELLKLNLNTRVQSLKIPIYFCMGKYDLTIPYEPAEAFLNHLSSPEKHWVWFDSSAHSPHFEEREKFAKLLHSESKKDLKK